ncbi:MAG: sigma factor-like helix-turn-helix DNA-binding protein [Agathobacter sp.]|nr:sigma factor-like helix-turn-helix DNA-binding protein [Agathobacter sp.]
MDEKLRLTYLYDFYGELLNDRQRQIYEDSVFNDLSLGEIAREEGISRQGVSDMVKRVEKKLESYESKLRLVEKFISIREDVEKIHLLAADFKESQNIEIMNDIETISNQILEEL